MSGQAGRRLPTSRSLNGSRMEQTLGKQGDNIVLVEVFQVNCPGCFMYGIPESIEIYNKYKSEACPSRMATAFEDYDKNTLKIWNFC
ncbi:MAG: hypothetical protein CM1200mP23_4860 [Nitrososphaerota archaeon]|nr:MAG: hypothetical protein CM1200mP23_4860 [Nitrososphaerota archaeon]